MLGAVPIGEGSLRLPITPSRRSVGSSGTAKPNVAEAETREKPIWNSEKQREGDGERNCVCVYLYMCVLERARVREEERANPVYMLEIQGRQRGVASCKGF